VVSTPIGNMGDFSFRAVEVLREVTLIVAEDTRHSRHLLARYEIATPVAAYHEHNEARATPGLVARLQEGEDIALISDAGTPLLSDPGERLVRAAIEVGVDVIPVPGASAVLAALVASGASTSPFTFYGFLPRKGSARKKIIDDLRELGHTAVLFESPLRIVGTLDELCSAGLAERCAAVSRELTKRFEATRRGTLGELSAYYQEAPPRGEIVLVIWGAAVSGPPENASRDRARELAAEGLSVRDIASRIVSELGVARNLAYRIARESAADQTSPTRDEAE
jgi:16S rRNA (cytidine1402-2'-O)-methyltransferase